MKPFKTLTSHAVLLPLSDIDTDQIVPARFLKTTSKDGVGEALFADWRFTPDGLLRPDFPLNQPLAQGAKILIVGSNFGCGSSREHASWALMQWGFEVVLGLSFADIFRANALQNGLLPIELDSDFLGEITSAIEVDPGVQITIDLRGQMVSICGGSTRKFSVDAFARKCLLEGMDQLDYLLALDDKITAYEVVHDKA